MRIRASRTETIKTILGAVLIILGVILVIGLVMSFPVMIAWDLVMPHVFGLPEINLIQAFCLVFLSTIFFRITAMIEGKL